MRQKIGNIIENSLIFIVGCVFIFIVVFDTIVLVHNHSGLLYEYGDNDMYLLLQIFLCSVAIVMLLLGKKKVIPRKVSSIIAYIIALTIIIVYIFRAIFLYFDLGERHFCEVKGLEFLSDRIGYTFVNRSGDIEIYYTEDGGKTWVINCTSNNQRFTTVSVPIHKIDSLVIGRVTCSDEFGFHDFEQEFVYNTCANSISFGTDTLDIEPATFDFSSSNNALLESKGYLYIEDIDSLYNMICILAKNPYAWINKVGLIYSNDRGITWKHKRLSFLEVGPICLTNNYLYVGSRKGIHRYSINRKRGQASSNKSGIIEKISWRRDKSIAFP